MSPQPAEGEMSPQPGEDELSPPCWAMAAFLGTVLLAGNGHGAGWSPQGALPVWLCFRVDYNAITTRLSLNAIRLLQKVEYVKVS